jgi:GNAT superfamily N-acetyltransferase
MIRNAEPRDVIAIHQLVCDLALYEKAPDEVINTPENLSIHLFEEKICEAIVCEVAGEIVGFALYYTAYSTWKGKALYLEDFYVKPENRGQGLGSALFDAVVEIAKKRGVKRMDWLVLEWNQLAIDFYTVKKAELDPEWLNGRIRF